MPAIILAALRRFALVDPALLAQHEFTLLLRALAFGDPASLPLTLVTAQPHLRLPLLSLAGTFPLLECGLHLLA